MKISMIRRALAVSVCVSLVLCACAEKDTAERMKEPEEEAQEIFVITEQDRKVFDENSEEIDLSSCNGELRITTSGDYLLSGDMEGRVIVDVYEDETVHLYLAGVKIASPAGPAVIVKSAAKLIVTLMSGEENTLTDPPDYEGYEDTKSCFYSVADLTINGEGLLNVYGYQEDGIRSKDVVKLLDCQINVQAKGDGIRGNDGIAVRDAELKVQSENNGLRTSKQGMDKKGSIEIIGGNAEVASGKNGIYAVTDVYLRDCQCVINSVEETIKAEGVSYIGEGCID